MDSGSDCVDILLLARPPLCEAVSPNLFGLPVMLEYIFIQEIVNLNKMKFSELIDSCVECVKNFNPIIKTIDSHADDFIKDVRPHPPHPV